MDDKDTTTSDKDGLAWYTPVEDARCSKQRRPHANAARRFSPQEGPRLCCLQPHYQTRCNHEAIGTAAGCVVWVRDVCVDVRSSVASGLTVITVANFNSLGNIRIVFSPV